MGRVIGIQSNIAEKLFTNETPLSGNVPLLHQEGRAWARMQSAGPWTLTPCPSLKPIAAPAKYRKLLGLDFCHDLSSSLCLQKVSLVKSFVSVISGLIMYMKLL